MVTSKYGRHKLANDGTRFGSGQAIVTPNVIRGELSAAYYALERLARHLSLGPSCRRLHKTR